MEGLNDVIVRGVGGLLGGQPIFLGQTFLVGHLGD